uniref:Uncharacterized protein n=1 Tax=Rhizophora mucronata TaxID=61149 RepID=A0A2P2QD51_RHIMU
MYAFINAADSPYANHHIQIIPTTYKYLFVE